MYTVISDMILQYIRYDGDLALGLYFLCSQHSSQYCVMVKEVFRSCQLTRAPFMHPSSSAPSFKRRAQHSSSTQNNNRIHARRVLT